MLPILLGQAEQALNLIAWKRKHTIVRIDTGGESVGVLRQVLARGYAVVTVVSKDCSSQKAGIVVSSVKRWVDDTNRPDRQLGWVEEETWEYEHPVKRLGVRWKTAKDTWRYAVLICAGLSNHDILTLIGHAGLADEDTIMRVYAHFYDLRSGGIESSFGQDKSGLGITKRFLLRFEAQRLLMLLGTLAHNLLVWSKRWLTRHCPPELTSRFLHYGINRIFRDFYSITA